MPRFFVDFEPQEIVTIDGEDGLHIAKSLRMKPGETLVLCDKNGLDYHCVITRITDGQVELSVRETIRTVSEPDIRLTLYMALPKGDKLEQIVKQSVELGAAAIVPVLTARCIVRPDEKTMEKKRQRLAKIAEEAAKQSGRGIIPEVHPLLNFKQAVQKASEDECSILCYEAFGSPIPSLVQAKIKTVSLMIGSEGGFDMSEAEYAKNHGVQLATLGKRILRCETAPIAAITAIMMSTGNMQ